MKHLWKKLLLLLLPTLSVAEWLPDGSSAPEFEVYRYPDSTYHSKEDITGRVVLYAFGSIT